MLALIAALDDADALLHVVWRVEAQRPTAEAVLDAAGALRAARNDLVRLVEATGAAPTPLALVPRQESTGAEEDPS